VRNAIPTLKRKNEWHWVVNLRRVGNPPVVPVAAAPPRYTV